MQKSCESKYLNGFLYLGRISLFSLIAFHVIRSVSVRVQVFCALLTCVFHQSGIYPTDMNLNANYLEKLGAFKKYL